MGGGKFSVQLILIFDSDSTCLRIQLMRAWGGMVLAKQASGLKVQSFVASGAKVPVFEFFFS